MTVYVLIARDWEEQPVIGVFSTLDLAQAAVSADAYAAYAGAWRWFERAREWRFVVDAAPSASGFSE